MADWFSTTVRGQDCAEAALRVDWGSTPLGDPAGWPRALRSAVELCFSTRFAVLVTWGPELTMIYNDGYRDMLGSDLHPRAMGAAAPELWGQIWDDVGPLFDDVMRSGLPTWDVDLPLLMDRSGFVEETRFTFSYSPLRDDDGVVRGVMDIATETTDQVVDRRRLSTLSRLSTALHGHRSDPATVARVATEVLLEAEDVTEVDVSLDVPVDGAGPAQPSPMAQPVWHGPLLVAPLAPHPDRAALGSITLRGTDRRPLDETQRAFLLLLATTVSNAVAEADEHRRRVTHLRSVSDTLQRAMVPDTPSSPRWQVRYRPADDNLSVGGDWFDVIELSGGRFGLVVGDCVGHGIGAAASMGRLSSAGRAVLLAGSGPAQTLSMLDDFARTVPGAENATVFCGIVDPQAMTLTYSSAGHPPGLLLAADGSTAWLAEARSVPLTLPHRGRTEHETTLSPGDLVLLYTDGLVERRDTRLRTGLERLATVAGAARAETSLDALPERLMDDMLADGARDDVALVVYRAG
ncbi:PP2C family protein-serine/threonine phosphatase [Isoptericola haloaureus]|uniref:SpoIIE family protein phosphatase n=1 Tax=Isoptericola haloaureus TaxID=1542902 RepID=A0ABU7Z2Z7_9MICO